MMALSILWFILVAVLWVGYLVLEGFDFGVGMLVPFVAKSDQERSAVIRTVGPHWDGNEVWLLTAGGATFAAFPTWYATMFSGMYLGLFLILVMLILRISAFEWRAKINSVKWRRYWDWMLIIPSYVTPLVLGVAFANLVQGMQIVVQNRLTLEVISVADVQEAIDSGLAVFNLTGGFWSLFTPYTLLGGVVVVLICLMQGSLFLSMKTTEEIHNRVDSKVGMISLITTVLAAVWVVWGQFAYSSSVWGWLPLVIAALALIGATVYSQSALRKEGLSFILSSVGIAGAVAWLFTSMAPSVMKSAIDPAYSLTISLASSTQGTLIVMTVVACIFVPIVLLYTIWSYWVFRSRVSVNDMEKQPGLLLKKIRLGANFLAG